MDELHDLVAHPFQFIHKARHVELLPVSNLDPIGKLVVCALELLRIVISVCKFRETSDALRHAIAEGGHQVS